MDKNIINDTSFNLKEDLPSLIYDGIIHKFGKNKHAWYVAKSWNFNNKDFYQVTVGSWKYDYKHTYKSWENGDSEYDAEFIQRQKEYNEQLSIKLKAETLEKYRKCVEKWFPIWQSADQDKVHEYLHNKKINYHFGSRVTSDNVLIIPAYNINGFVGVQQIYQDKETFEFVKRFSYGINKKGSFLALRDFRYSQVCYLAEGFATAATIQDCFKNTPVVCAFDSGNIIPVIQTIRIFNPGIKIVIAADYDVESGTGQLYAEKAIRQYDNVTYKLPIFENNKDNKLSDFNDLMITEGKDKVFNILK